jgi:hypothetical protein
MGMPKELYFDIHAEASGGSLYRVVEPNGEIVFLYNYSVSDTKTGEVTVHDTWYTNFAAFWKALTRDAEWQESHQRQWKKVLTNPGSYYGNK